jgi:15-cis-phytoene synthase
VGLDIQKYEQYVFERGNITCYTSARFFPRRCRDGILELYCFMKEVDGYLDVKPLKPEAFVQLRRAWEKAKADPNFSYEPSVDDTTQIRTVKHLVGLVRKWRVEPEWIDTYFATRQADLMPKTYKTIDETLAYVQGTAEVLALMMCRVLNFNPIISSAACLEARGIQYLNFIRDIGEYNNLERCYIPQDELALFGLPDTSKKTAEANDAAFKDCIRQQVERCEQWLALPKEDMIYLPRDCRVPMITAVEMYEWTAATILNDPFIVFDHKVKPTRHRVLIAGLSNMLTPH